MMQPPAYLTTDRPTSLARRRSGAPAIARDLARDWQRWSQAERIAAGSIPFLLVVLALALTVVY